MPTVPIKYILLVIAGLWGFYLICLIREPPIGVFESVEAKAKAVLTATISLSVLALSLHWFIAATTFAAAFVGYFISKKRFLTRKLFRLLLTDPVPPSVWIMDVAHLRKGGPLMCLRFQFMPSDLDEFLDNGFTKKPVSQVWEAWGRYPEWWSPESLPDRSVYVGHNSGFQKVLWVSGTAEEAYFACRKV